MLRKKGQVFIEFTFCMIVILLFFYGCVMAFRWAGLSLANRRISHDKALNASVRDKWTAPSGDSAIIQINPKFDKGTPMNLIFNRW